LFGREPSDVHAVLVGAHAEPHAIVSVRVGRDQLDLDAFAFDVEQRACFTGLAKASMVSTRFN